MPARVQTPKRPAMTPTREQILAASAGWVAVLLCSRSRQVCMTCHFFRHHAGPNCIPVLACHLHQGLIAHGEHLTHRCSGWTEDLHRQRGWTPEAA